MIHYYPLKGIAALGSLLLATSYGGHEIASILAEGLTKDTPVSLEAACIVGASAVGLAVYLGGMKRDIKQMKSDIRILKATHPFRKGKAAERKELERQDREDEKDEDDDQ